MLKRVDVAVFETSRLRRRRHRGRRQSSSTWRRDGVGYSTSAATSTTSSTSSTTTSSRSSTARSRCRPHPDRNVRLVDRTGPEPHGGPGPSASPGTRSWPTTRPLAPTGTPGRRPGAGRRADGDLEAVPRRRGEPRRQPARRAGTIHAIVGENGAGKSTLMKILYGMQRPDEGTIAVDGRPGHFRSPTDAIAHGIGMVHQHFMLADNLTVLENVVLGPNRPVPRPARLRRARDRIDELKPDLRASTSTRPARRAARRRRAPAGRDPEGAVPRGRILILDEPTAVLVPQEVDELFATSAS
jgi:ABC-type ATPase involved in cell division